MKNSKETIPLKKKKKKKNQNRMKRISNLLAKLNQNH